MEQVPDALRVGSPAAEKGIRWDENFSSAGRRASAAHDLFPSRPASVVSLEYASNDRNNRYSLPPPLTPAFEPAYQIPDAPPPPSFPDVTAYEFSSTSAKSRQYEQSSRPKRERSLLSKLGSIRSSRLGRHGAYGRIEEDEENDIGATRRGRLHDVEEDEGEGLGVDLSGFEGPYAMRDLSSKKGATTHHTEQDAYDDGDRGRLGAGMALVVDAPVFIRAATQRRGHRRGASTTDPKTADAVQKAADKTGRIMAVTETVDISSLGGAEYESRSILSTTQDAKTTYFFPEGNDKKPAWRPFSMGWPYITFLIVIALVLAGLQEFLCQISLKRAEDERGLLNFRKPQDITITDYFAWKYAPTLALVTYGVLWQITDYEVKRLEPFYQLSRKGGATAASSLNIDYLTFLSYLIPLKALRYRQWAVVFSSLATLLAGSLVPVLQSAALTTRPDKAHRDENGNKYVSVDPVWSRLLSGSLLAIAICGILLSIQLRRKSGLLSDPKGIAGIAAMATKAHILQDFQGLDTASNQAIHHRLKDRRYNLHQSSLWQGQYLTTKGADEKNRDRKVENPHPIMLRLAAGIPYILFCLSFVVAIPIFMFVEDANLVTEKLPWLLTALATVIKLGWNTLDCDIRVLEPYFILSNRRAPPRTMTLDYTGTIPGWLSIRAALNKHFLVSAVGLGAILCEVLTVCVSSFSVDGKKFLVGQGGHDRDRRGVFVREGPGPRPPGSSEDDINSPFNATETFRSFWISLVLALVIIIYLMVTASLVYVYRRHKFLPRQPGTIASVLAYICSSKMLDDFIGTEEFNSDRMTSFLEAKKYTYGLGWFNGRYGSDCVGVDREPLLADYKHGVDRRTSRLCEQIGTWDQY